MRVFNLKNYNKILDETPFQTAGPFLHIGCMPNKIKINNLYKNDLGEVPFKNKNEIEMITIEGSVFDGNGITLDDVMLETWQCDENGQFFEDNQSPHICLSISSRGLNMTLNTRIYFEGDDLINDPILSMIKNNKGNIDSLVAKKIKKNVYAFDVFLQGDKETVFFDI